MNSPNYLNSHTSASSFGKRDKQSRQDQGSGSAMRSVRVNRLEAGPDPVPSITLNTIASVGAPFLFYR